MSVYRNDKPELVKRAIDSITVDQIAVPDEIVIVADGPVSKELSQLLDVCDQSPHYNFKIIRLPENKGLGNALRVGTENASFPLVARMDSDDVSLPDRFKSQLEYFETHSDCDILGGQMTEFIGDESNIVGKRIVPQCDSEIKKYLKSRCPLNHVTVMFKRDAILKIGNYQDWHFNEDYYLWIRAALANCTFYNLPDALVNVRVGREMYQRRGGWKYFKSEARLQWFMLSRRLISLPRYAWNCALRFAIQVAMPNSIRGFIFQKFARTQS